MTEMAIAYNLAAAAVKRRLADMRPEYIDALESLKKRDIAVYGGSYDKVEEVLKRLRIPFTWNPRLKKLDARVVFANCSSADDHRLAKSVEAIVREGTWLVSSDWSLSNIVAKAFPRTIARRNGRNSGDEVVAVEPGLNSYWEEVVVLGADPQWWLENSSFLIDVLDTDRVSIEAASHELLVRYNAPAVAVQFDWHAGRVFHIVSHFWLTRSRAPAEKYRGPCTEFLKQGLRLSDDAVDEVLRKAKVKPEEINFAMIQSAATATELVVQLCQPQWLAMAAHSGDTRFQIAGLVPVRLADEVRAFDVVRTRFDGSSFWFDDIDPARDAATAEFLRQSLKKTIKPSRLKRPKLTPEEKAVYALRYFQNEKVIKQLEADATEARLREALKHSGAEFVDFLERRDSYRVTYNIGGRRHVSAVRKDDLTVQVAGICLDGQDQHFDLASLVGVIREGEAGGEIVPVGRDNEGMGEDEYWNIHPPNA
eukprot:g26655.t1